MPIRHYSTILTHILLYIKTAIKAIKNAVCFPLFCVKFFEKSRFSYFGGYFYGTVCTFQPFTVPFSPIPVAKRREQSHGHRAAKRKRTTRQKRPVGTTRSRRTVIRARSGSPFFIGARFPLKTHEKVLIVIKPRESRAVLLYLFSGYTLAPKIACEGG